MLHITNGEATKTPLEQSGLPGRCSSWDDILHDGPTPLVSGDDWLMVRAAYLASAGYGSVDDIARSFRVKDDALERLEHEDEVIFWFEHDLYDQLLLIRHLWWIGEKGAGRADRYSIVIGTDYLGMLRPEEFPPRFAERQTISGEQIRLGTAAWTAFCSGNPASLVPIASGRGEYAEQLPFLPRAMRRQLEEFPSAANGLARSERQILEVLSEGNRTPEQTFVAASLLEEDIWMGDWSFWTIVKRMNAGPHPLLTLDVEDRPDRLPHGTLQITQTGRAVLAGRADHVALNGISRWIGGTRLTPDRLWRWTGSSLLPPAA